MTQESLAVKVGRVEEAQSFIKEDIQEIKAGQKELLDYIKGNGKAGINERVRRLEDQTGINDDGLTGMVTGLWRNGKATIVAYGALFANWLYDLIERNPLTRWCKYIN